MNRQAGQVEEGIIPFSQLHQHHGRMPGYQLGYLDLAKGTVDQSGCGGGLRGDDKLVKKLNTAFEDEASSHFVFSYGRGKVSYANPPGCSNAHVFSHVGHPWLSQYLGPAC